MTIKVISGGQTGMDQFGLRTARKLGIKTGGTTVKGFRTENGNNPSLKKFGLADTASSYAERTKINVKDSDITLIWSQNRKSSGTICTISACNDTRTSCYVNQWNPEVIMLVIRRMISVRNTETEQDFVINIAGNRGSKMDKDFSNRAIITLYKVLKELKEWQDAGFPEEKPFPQL